MTKMLSRPRVRKDRPAIGVCLRFLVIYCCLGLIGRPNFVLSRTYDVRVTKDVTGQTPQHYGLGKGYFSTIIFEFVVLYI